MSDFKTVKQRNAESIEVERAVYCALETGNEDQARTLIIEYREINYESSRQICQGVLETYGIEL